MSTLFPSGLDALYDLSTNPPMNDPSRRASVVLTDIQDAIRAMQVYGKIDTRWQFCDMHTTTAAQMSPFTASAALNAGSNTTAVTAADYPGSGAVNGLNYVRSGGSANGGWRYAPNQSYRGNAGLTARFIFSPKTSVAGTAFIVGTHNSTTATSEPTNGCYLWVTAGGTATFKTAKGGVRSSSSSITLAAGTWYCVDVWYLTTTVARCAVTNALTGAVLYLVDLATNVPNATTELIQPCWMGWNSATNSDVAYVDLGGFGPITPAFVLRNP